MDLNQLIHRQGVERLRARTAACAAARAAHLGLADLFGARIDRRRLALFAVAAVGPDARAPRL